MKRGSAMSEMVVQVREREPEWAPPEVRLPIRSNDDYVVAAEALRVVAEYRKRVTEWFRDMKETARQHWLSIVEKEKAALAKPAEWEARLKEAIAAWDAHQEELRRAEERRLAEEARKAEEARRLEEAAALEAEALAEGDERKLEEAQELVAAPIETPVVQVEKATPKVQGLSFRENWDAKVVDFGALVAFVAQHPSHQNLLLPNQVALRQMARSLKQNMAIPGVKAFSTKVVARR